MSSRRTVATTQYADNALMLQDLLAIKQRRKTALRRQMAQQQSLFHQLEQDMRTCLASRALLAEKRNAWLAWSGMRMSDELLAQKQTLMELHDKDQQWVAHQRALSDQQHAVLARQDAVRQALRTVMKKKEKLCSVLNKSGNVR